MSTSCSGGSAVIASARRSITMAGSANEPQPATSAAAAGARSLVARIVVTIVP
jgi:hypothetical protein